MILLLSSPIHRVLFPNTRNQIKAKAKAKAKAMERSPSPKGTDEVASISCCGYLKLKLPWRKRWMTRQRSEGCNLLAVVKTASSRKPGVGCRYDPLSYAQNFDEGCWDEDNEDYSHRGFSSRFAAPAVKALGN
ncbi:hypothetical protein NE237_017567 [Protea cynaroides]|uniref:Uncharacterized protein n=1 Tax=Protea cynaroides TaxID=273540 RepID=A0A9Q0K8A0_9MAGN|nr:hypothetical protein NE237_017567 [Protea cynaroides]